MKDFSPGMWKLWKISTLGNLLYSSMPCHQLNRRAERHLWWGEGSNLCCQFSCWDPARSQMEWAASRPLPTTAASYHQSLCNASQEPWGCSPSWAPPEHCQHYLLLGGTGSCTAAAATQFYLRENYKLLLCRWESCCFPEEQLPEHRSLHWAVPLRHGSHCFWRSQKSARLRSQEPVPDWEMTRPAPTSSPRWVWRSAAAPFPRGRSSLLFRAADSAPQSCWAQQQPSWTLNCKLALCVDKNSTAQITLTPK